MQFSMSKLDDDSDSDQEMNPVEKRQALEVRCEQQQKQLKTLQRRMNEQNKILKGVASSRGSSLSDNVNDIKKELTALKERQKKSVSDVFSLRDSKKQFMPALDQIRQTESELDKGVESVKEDQERIKQEMRDIKEWQREAVRIKSQREEGQRSKASDTESATEKDAKTKTLVKELQQILKTELKERSRFRAKFSLTQTMSVLLPWPKIVDEYKNVKLACKYFDSRTGKYTAPIRGIYKFTAMVALGTKGKVQFNLRYKSGKTLIRGQGGEVSGGFQAQKDFYVKCDKDEAVWIELRNLNALESSEIMDCQFCGELMDEIDEEMV